MDAAFKFLASQNGRIARIVAGIVIVVLGLLIGGVGGWIIALIGLAPIAAGGFDFCIFAPLFGHAFKGPDLRKELEGK